MSAACWVDARLSPCSPGPSAAARACAGARRRPSPPWQTGFGLESKLKRVLGAAQTTTLCGMPDTLLGRHDRTELLVQPDSIEAYNIINTKVVGWIVALHVVVPTIVHALPGYRE